MITHAELLSLLRYEPETGNFIWVNPGKTKPGLVGKIAGSSKTCHPLIRIMILRKSYFAHRLAWFYVYKRWPSEMIDHINGNPFDNRIANLREASPRQNQFNRRTQKNNRLGVSGVTQRRSGKFVSRIRINGYPVHLGTFDTIELAQAAYTNAAIATRGEFARLD